MIAPDPIHLLIQAVDTLRTTYERDHPQPPHPRLRQRLAWLATGQPDPITADLTTTAHILDHIEHTGLDDVIIAQGIVRLTWLWPNRCGEIDITGPWAICWSSERLTLGMPSHANIPAHDYDHLRHWITTQSQSTATIRTHRNLYGHP